MGIFSFLSSDVKAKSFTGKTTEAILNDTKLDKYTYFNKTSFINIETFNDNTLNYIKNLNENENLYNNFLNQDIINKDFDNENYIRHANEFIQSI